MRNLVYLPVQLIKDAESDGWLRSASYFLRLKSLYKNNTHYGFSSRSLADKVKCSPATLLFHLRVLEQKGLIRYHSNNISFIGLKKMRLKYGYKTIGVPVNTKNQLDILRCQIIRFNLSAQAYNINKSGIQKLRREGGLVDFSSKEKIWSSYTGLSAKGTGNLFDLSLSSGSRIRTKLSVMGLLKCERVYSILFKNKTISDYKGLRNSFFIPTHSFFSKGNIVVERRPMMEYSVLRKVISIN